MTEDMKSKIQKIVEQERITSKNLFLFEQIPPKKLSNAVNSYALTFDSGESIIMLYDDTAFGSAKQGFLLTARRLYSRSTVSKPVCADITNITKIDYTHSSLGKVTLFIETPEGTFDINAVQIVAKGYDSLPRILYQTIKLINTTEYPMTMVGHTHADQALRCRGCGAMNENNADSCEYCGGTNFAVPEGASATTAASGGIRYYKECPDVPDFGAAVGIPLLRVEDNSISSSLNILYYYSKRDISQEKLNGYIKLVKEKGIKYCGYDSKFSVHEFSQENHDDRCIGIFMSNDRDECFLQIVN